jgi:predicted dehydrogenase
MIRIGVVGYGYWGPNIVRNFSRLTNATVAWVCDVVPKTLREIPLIYPTIKTTNTYQDLLTDPSLDAVVIVTPTHTHRDLARRAILAGKHVLVEKPMTTTAREARDLVNLAKRKKRILMVDHTFIYTPAIRMLKKIITSSQLGDVYYIDSVRTNLGIVQKDTNVVYDLATHDFSIMDYLFRRTPKTITATGITHKDLKQETVAYIGAAYSDNLFFHCHVSWLSPIKIRRMIFVGTKKMLTYDDIEPSEKLKMYDKGVSLVKDPKQSYQLRIGYRTGNAVVPNIPIEEGLYGMAEEFIRAIRLHKQPATDGSMGFRVVTCIEAATKSLRSGGKQITV